MLYEEPLKNPEMCGCLPNSETPGIVADLFEAEAPWDATDKPAISSWSSLKPWLEEQAEIKARLRSQGKYEYWWDTCVRLGFDVNKLLITSQGAIGSCAGVSYFDRCYLTTLLHQIAAGSEQQIEPVNALASWLESKGWSRRGGQSISAVVQEGCSGGVYTASQVGEYSASWYDSSAVEKHTADAEKRQMGACLVDSSEDKAEAALLALRAGLVVEVGQGIAISGEKTDEHGVPVLSLAGSWSHATAATELVIIDGVEYVQVTNSHGLAYLKQIRGPRFGGLLTLDDMKRYFGGGWCDVAIVTHVESPYDPKASHNLNP